MYLNKIEVMMLNTLKFHVSFPTSYQFLRLLLDDAGIWSEESIVASARSILVKLSFVPGIYMSTDPSLAASGALAVAMPMHALLSNDVRGRITSVITCFPPIAMSHLPHLPIHLGFSASHGAGAAIRREASVHPRVPASRDHQQH